MTPIDIDSVADSYGVRRLARRALLARRVRAWWLRFARWLFDDRFEREVRQAALAPSLHAFLRGEPPRIDRAVLEMLQALSPRELR